MVSPLREGCAETPLGRYQIYLKSTSGPVEVFLVSQTDNDAADVEANKGDAECAPAGSNPGIVAASDGGRTSKKRLRGCEFVDMQVDGIPARVHAGGDEEGLLKLDPVVESEAEYWASAPMSQELGLADLYFGEQGQAK
jgi:hypothetical protein